MTESGVLDRAVLNRQIEEILDAMDRPGGVHDTADVWVTFRDKLD